MLNKIILLMPILLLLVLVEGIISYRRKDNRYNLGNTTMNMAIGMLDQIGSFFYYMALYVVLDFSYRHFSLFKLEDNWQQWVLAFFAIDFLSYWYHRFSHRINILWAGHVTHHSSELFNFSNGFRTSLFQGLNRIIFWAILPVFGFSPLILVISLKVSGIYDFMVHTTYVPKLPWIEKILITPSLHRVHHGKNDIYIDKNYGSVLSVWDRMFGTYVEETEEVKYGIKSNYTDNNPVNAIGHYYIYLFKTMRKINSWSTRLKLLIMPPEWNPIQINNLENNQILQTINTSSSLRFYAVFHTVFSTLFFILMMIYNEIFNNYEIALISITVAFSMTMSAKIFNRNIKSGFERRENLRLWLSIILTAVILTFAPHFYMLYILFYLLISVILLMKIKITENVQIPQIVK